MKKSLIAVLLAGMLTAVVCVGSVVPITADDTEKIENGLKFSVTDTSATLVGFAKDSARAEVIVPEKVGGVPVTAIGAEAFIQDQTIQSIVLPDSVLVIRDMAFGESTIETITFGKGLLSIGDYAFCGCMKLTEITFPESLKTIGMSAFENCEALKTVTFQSLNVDIGDNAFPEDVTVIKPSLFTLDTEGVRATAGATFSVPFSFTGNLGFNYLKLSVSYPADIFTLTDVSGGSLFAGDNMFAASEETTKNPQILVFASAGDVDAESGTLCTLTFTVKDSAGKDDFTGKAIGITVVECLDAKDAPVTLTVSADGIPVVWYTPGDVTDDGEIGGADLTHLLQYLAEWENVTCLSEAADVNADGEVNGADATLLLQYLAEWDVTLGVAQAPQS